MIDSTPTASGAVVDKGTTGTSEPVVEADAGRQAEKAGKDALAQPGHGTRPVPLQGEEVLAGPDDRLDALADGGQVRTVAGLVLARSRRWTDRERGGARWNGTAVTPSQIARSRSLPTTPRSTSCYRVMRKQLVRTARLAQAAGYLLAPRSARN